MRARSYRHAADAEHRAFRAQVVDRIQLQTVCAGHDYFLRANAWHARFAESARTPADTVGASSAPQAMA